MTLQQLRQKFKSDLADFPASESKALISLLMKARLDLNNSDFLLHPEREISAEQESVLLQDLVQIKSGVPIQQVIGFTEFMGLHLLLNQHCLIPRPETEELIVETLGRLSFQPQLTLDIGTGSACIALAIKKALRQSEVWALEKSQLALEIAKSNARGNSLEVNFIEGDMLTYSTDQKFDLIISNPPYIRNSEKEKMEQNVLDYEPHMALFVDDEKPLLFYEAIVRIGQEALSERGLIALEINQELAEQTEQLFVKAGFKTEKGKDLSGNWRFIWAWR